MSDNEILALSYKEPARFADLFDRHNGRLLAIASKMTGSREESEDIVQETFVRIYKHGRKFLDNKKYEAGGNFSHWSNVILKNCILDNFRKRKTKEVALTDEIEATAKGEDEYALLESKNYLESVFSKLPQAAAEVLKLHYLFGKSFKEIGKRLGISSAAARVRAHRAKKYFLEIHHKIKYE